MNKTIIKSFSVWPLRTPLNQSFRTALGEHKTLDNLLFTITLEDKTIGAGEAAVATHITGETIERTKLNLNIIGQSLLGSDVRDYLKISKKLHERLKGNACALAAIETALMDALTRHLKIPLWKIFGEKPRKLQSDITIVIADLKETESSVRKYLRRGFRAFKVKIGRDEDLDCKRVLVVKKCAPKSDIYLDANQGYTATQTLQVVKYLKARGVQVSLLEQPVPREDFEGLKRVTRLAGVPVCADESARSIEDVERIIKEKAAQVINIKLMKTGLVQGRKIALLARAHGLDLMIGGMMESSLAMTASAHLAAGLGCFKYIDLDTPFFLKKGFQRNPFLSSRGIYDLSKVKAGIGIDFRKKLASQRVKS